MYWGVILYDFLKQRKRICDTPKLTRLGLTTIFCCREGPEGRRSSPRGPTGMASPPGPHQAHPPVHRPQEPIRSVRVFSKRLCSFCSFVNIT